jgi:hypothetical protein
MAGVCLAAFLLFLVWSDRAEAAPVHITLQRFCEESASTEFDSTVGTDVPNLLPRQADGPTVNSIRKSYRIEPFSAANPSTTMCYGTLIPAKITHFACNFYESTDFDCAGNRIVLAIRDGTSNLLRFRFTSAEVFQVSIGIATFTTITTPSKGAQHQLHACIYKYNGTPLLETVAWVWIDNMTPTELIGQNWSAITPDHFWFGANTSSASDNGYLFFDDFTVDTTRVLPPAYSIRPVESLVGEGAFGSLGGLE